MVDLAKMRAEQEAILRLQKEKKSFLQKSQERVGSVIRRKKNVDTETFSLPEQLDNFDYEDKVSFIPDGQINKEKKKRSWEGLAIVQFFQAIWHIFSGFFSLLEQICFRTGWFLLFVVRFVYFFFLLLLRGLKRLFMPFLSIFSARSGSRSLATPLPEPESPRFYSFVDPAQVAEALEQIPEAAPLPRPAQMPAPLRLEKQPEFSQEFFRDEVHVDSPDEPNYANRRPSLLKASLGFAILLVVLTLPFKMASYYGVLRDLGGRVLGASEEAIGDIKNAGSAASDFDFYEAGERFAAASDSFIQAQEEIELISGELKVLGAIIPDNRLKLAADADKILAAASISAKIGQQISFMFDAFSMEKEKSIKTVFLAFNDNIGPLKDSSTELARLLSEIEPDNLPQDYQASFRTLQERSDQISKSFFELDSLIARMHSILGFEGEKRYLLIFQNNSEMRGSGGFMGSYSIVDFRDGEITKLETPKGGTYDTEAGYLKRIVAPEPLHIVNPLWHFWDANWWPDWKKTAKKLMWFYENSGGSSVDGVIAITPVVAERLLEIIGPLDMQDTHGVTMTHENFWETTQTFAEEKPLDHPDYYPLPFVPTATSALAFASSTETKEIGTEPKKIIGDLLAEIRIELPKRIDKDMFLGLLAGFEQSLSEKHALFYFNDWQTQAKFEELDWAGRMHHTEWDYLMVTNTNISGAKSDRKIAQKIDHQAEVQPDGRIVNTLLISRTHTGLKGEKFSGVKNLDWMRIYLPLGSRFISAEGFWPPDESTFEKPDPSWQHDPDLKASEENFVRDSVSWTKIYNEDDKTVFANWAQVDPGQTVRIVVRYELPFTISLDNENEEPYALMVEKQPGAMPSDFSSRLILAPGQVPSWYYPENLGALPDGWQINETGLALDRFYAIALRPKE
jgi:hypothetical protein